MKQYGVPGRDTGIVNYEAGSGFIRIQFTDGSIYLYDSTRPGSHHVDQMKALAAKGKGLTTYINQHVRGEYARRER